MIIGRSRIRSVLNSLATIGCLFLLSVTLISCSGGSGGGVTLGAGGDASAITVSSGNGGAIDNTSVTTQDNEAPPASGPTFEELMASSVDGEAFGNVIDSAVSGLRYKSGEHYGITDSAGTYGYLEGESVEFFIGGIRIGEAIEPAARLTPYELAQGNEQVALNIARFLQTLDNDADPENGIRINNAVQSLAEGRTLDFSSPGWQGRLISLELVEGEWVPKRPNLELLVFELTSATEAGARDLLSASSAMVHLSSTFREIVFSLTEEAESLLRASTCETDSQCKWTQLSLTPSLCGPSKRSLVYSEVDADLPAFELLEAQRVYLIDVSEKLERSAWGPDNTIASCNTIVTPTWAICGESNHCEITTSWPVSF